MAYRTISPIICAVPVTSRTADDLIICRVPLVLRTFPNPETAFRVTASRPDVHWRVNGKRVVGSVAKAALRFAVEA